MLELEGIYVRWLEAITSPSSLLWRPILCLLDSKIFGIELATHLCPSLKIMGRQVDSDF